MKVSRFSRRYEVLSIQLTEPWMTKRLEAPTLPNHVRDNIENILPKAMEQMSTEDETCEGI